MATVYVGSASIDENGKANGGKAGNQTGRELKKQAWYAHSKGWRVFRAKDGVTAERIAAAMAAAVANRHIGYDQYQRNTLYREAAKVGFDPSKVTVDCETDCSALVRVCCAYAGILGLPEGFRTTNEPKNLLATGAFTELVGERYTKQSAYLKRGDILCTATQGHTVVVLNDGAFAQRTEGASAVKQVAPETRDPAQAEGAGRNGREAGATVKEPQKFVRITGGTVNVRKGPGVGNPILGVAKKGERLAWLNESREAGGRPWHRVSFAGKEGWVSSRYGELEA